MAAKVADAPPHDVAPGYRLGQRLRHAPERQAAVHARRDPRLHQHRAEQRHEGDGDRLGRRHPAGADRRRLRHELQEHPRIRLELRLCVGLGPDHPDDHHPAGRVPLAQVDLDAMSA